MKNIVLWKYLISKPEHWPAENATQTMELKLIIQGCCIFSYFPTQRFTDFPKMCIEFFKTVILVHVLEHNV